MYAQKADDPIKSYEELREAVDDAMSIDDNLIENHPQRDWFREA